MSIPKDPATMTAAAINKALDKIDALRSQLGTEFIEAGRGHERPSETATKTDPLATRANELFRQYMILEREIAARYGPGAPSRLPTGRGFGPRKKIHKHGLACIASDGSGNLICGES